MDRDHDTPRQDSCDLAEAQQQLPPARSDEHSDKQQATTVPDIESRTKEVRRDDFDLGVPQKIEGIRPGRLTGDHGPWTAPASHQRQATDSAFSTVRPWQTNALSASESPVFSRAATPSSVTAPDLPSPRPESSCSRPLPEFFSQATFQTVINNPTISHQLLKFARSRLCGENLDFLAKVARYRALLEKVSKSIYDIHQEFISTSSPTQINLPEAEQRRVNLEMKSALATTLPSLECVFLDAQGHIEDLVFQDVYPRFVQYQMSVSAANALGRDRSKFGGLGDCFVLTDPNKADNPIVFASDGFVSMTGYQRTEIIPRNCRFMQSKESDKKAVRRLRTATDRRQEYVELLLNRKKNGEPFWNLLYITSLFDQSGKLVFFLGGQIDCSTAVHSASDVLRVLAQSNEPEDEGPQIADPPRGQTVKASRSLTFIRSLSFGAGHRDGVQPRAPGVQSSLLEELDHKAPKDQKSSFHSAYSHYIVINHPSYLIGFVSCGILALLFPISSRHHSHHSPVIGTDIFKFLTNVSASFGAVGSSFKAAVKQSLDSGQPISLELKLCARPDLRFEKFVLHWTPLKDEKTVVRWIVLTLGNCEGRVGVGG